MDNFLLFYLVSILSGMVAPKYTLENNNEFMALVVGFYLLMLGVYCFTSEIIYLTFGIFGDVFSMIPIAIGFYLFARGMFG